jgi:hypothetical protein
MSESAAGDDAAGDDAVVVGLPDGGALDERVAVRRYLRLLVAVVALFVVQAAFPAGDVARLLEVLVAGAALVMAAQLEGHRERSRRIAVVVVAVSLALGGATLVFGGDGDSGGGFLLVNGLLVAAGPVLVFRAIRRHPTVSLSTMLGAVTVYVLVGLFFAMVYRSVLLFDPAAFVSANSGLDPAAMQYFSFVTLTTVGFGDITAVTSIARTLVALEALLGQIYLVTVVALVVGNLGRRRA